MIKIFKYNLRIYSKQEVTLPEGARILDFQAQKDDIVFWAQVDVSKTAVETVTFLIVPTGEAFSQDFIKSEYLKTIQLYNQTEVYHIFKKLG